MLVLLGEIETDTEGGAGVIETLASTVTVDWAALCAVTLTAPEGTAAGAVYRPVEEIVPTVVLPPLLPFTNQLTAVFVVLVIVALNCCVFPTCRLVLVGKTEIDTEGGAGVIETLALAVTVDSTALCAVTVTAQGGTTAGAV